MLRRFTVILTSFLLPLSIQSQNRTDYNQKFTEGNLLILEGNYVQALKNFLWARNIDSTNANINYKIGLCYLNTITERTKALPYLEHAYKITGDVPGINYLLAAFYLHSGNIEKASRHLAFAVEIDKDLFNEFDEFFPLDLRTGKIAALLKKNGL